MTRDNWYSNTENRVTLEKLLQDPVLLRAFEVLSIRELDPIIGPGSVDLVQYFAIMGAKKEGYLEFYKSLIGLSKIPKTIKPSPPPWEGPETK